MIRRFLNLNVIFFLRKLNLNVIVLIVFGFDH